MEIPFVDLSAQYQCIKTEIDAAVSSVIGQCAFIRGPFVEEFETRFASRLGVKHCVSVANGTDALFVTMKMLGIGPGDQVITTALSWIASSETVSLCGADVVFADVDPRTLNMDVAAVESQITARTKAILAVHLHGRMADVVTLRDLCESKGILLIEDCAQAHFASTAGKNAGLWGVAGTFSFYPGKNLGAYGDAGCVVTDDSQLASRIRMFANHGSVRKHDHRMEGVNSRMDGLQAAVLNAKLVHIDEWTARRRLLASRYDVALRQFEHVKRPASCVESEHVHHVYAIRVSGRDDLARFLNDRGVRTAVHYPKPLPLLDAYSGRGHRPEDFPCATAACESMISLPIYPELSATQQDHVVSSVAEFLHT